MKLKNRAGLFCFFSLFFIGLYAKKVVITGGAGFIGSNVAEQLLKRGDSVIIIDNINNYYDEALKYKNLSDLAQMGTSKTLQVYKTDICDVGGLNIIFEKEKPDVICHLAARAGVRSSIKDPTLYLKTNIIGTLNILEMARKYGIKHVVIASSSSVYGDRKKVPFREDQLADKQSSPYAMSKKATELLAYTYYHLHGISATCLRLFTVYGPRGRDDMAPLIFLDAMHRGKTIKLCGDGSIVRDFTYVGDIVDGIIRAIDKPLGYEILNLGRGNPITLSEFIATIEKVVNKKAKIKNVPVFAADVSITHADISKARKLLGYNPKISVEDGMRYMYEWYCSHSDLFSKKPINWLKRWRMN